MRFLPSGVVASHVVVALFFLSSCGNRKDQFLQGRTLDACTGSWPVCSQIVGCLLGAESYSAGTFPARTGVLIQLTEPSTVYASLFIENIQASGVETAINFYEGGCRQRIRLAVTGQEFVSEVQQQGTFTRQADLIDVGDHLIEVESDAACRYSLKVDVVPTRLQGGAGL